MRGRSDGGKKKPLIVLLCAAAFILVFVYLFFGSSNNGASVAIEYGRKHGLSGDNDNDHGTTKKDDTPFYVGDDVNGFTPRSFRVSFVLIFLKMIRGSVDEYRYFLAKVCDDWHSELIPCLDRNLIYQMRLKLDLSLMEHCERHLSLMEHSRFYSRELVELIKCL